jgi:hypothetical protein
MIAVSVKDGERIVDLLLSRGADVNQTSRLNSMIIRVFFLTYTGARMLTSSVQDNNGQVGRPLLWETPWFSAVVSGDAGLTTAQDSPAFRSIEEQP